MIRNSSQVRSILSDNFRMLKTHYKLTDLELEKKTHVSGKTCNNVINQTVSTTIDRLESIAESFGYGPYTMLIKLGERTTKLELDQLDRLIKDYISASDEGREFICAAAKREKNTRATKKD